jgi:hypothetical protein
MDSTHTCIHSLLVYVYPYLSSSQQAWHQIRHVLYFFGLEALNCQNCRACFHRPAHIHTCIMRDAFWSLVITCMWILKNISVHYYGYTHKCTFIWDSCSRANGESWIRMKSICVLRNWSSQSSCFVWSSSCLLMLLCGCRAKSRGLPSGLLQDYANMMEAAQYVVAKRVQSALSTCPACVESQFV